jgi:hypothetical protein
MECDTIVSIVVDDVMFIQKMFAGGTRPFNLGGFEIPSFLGMRHGGSLPPNCWVLLEFFQNKCEIEIVLFKVTFLFEL